MGQEIEQRVKSMTDPVILAAYELTRLQAENERLKSLAKKWETLAKEEEKRCKELQAALASRTGE